MADRPTIEILEFEVKTSKSRHQGLDVGTPRSFAFTAENLSRYRLIEDQADYVFRFPGEPGSGVLVGPSKFKKLVFIRYDDAFWSTFDPDVPITATLESSPPDRPGPAAASRVRIGVAVDLLNLGIADVGTNAIAWDGLRFKCPKNEAGHAVAGEVVLDANRVPTELRYEIQAEGRSYPYRVRLEFGPDGGVAGFFPRRVLVEFMGKEKLSVVSDYRVKRLEISRRHLGFGDLSYEPFFRWADGHYFAYSNASVYLVSNSVDGQTGR